MIFFDTSLFGASSMRDWKLLEGKAAGLVLQVILINKCKSSHLPLLK